MDDIVKQAMAKWPNVPHCYGWLGLDARGNWYLRDDRAQAAGHFGSGKPGAKGALLTHEKLIDFIQRNYQCDEWGQWFFQNGPQRVYVELQATPWVWRVGHDFSVKAHTGQPCTYQQAWVDENGHLYLTTNTGFGLVHTQDVVQAAQAFETGVWSVEAVQHSDLMRQYGYIQSPQQAQHADKKKPTL
jgi:hypothetical protein